jgi:hypothetical protein
MTKDQVSSMLSEAAIALASELRRFEELADQAARVNLNTEKNLQRATEALTRAAESQDRIQGHVQQLVAAVAAARQKQESDAAALLERAARISDRRKEFVDILQRMAGLGRLAAEIQDALRGGPGVGQDVPDRMQQIADAAADIVQIARDREMEEVARQADVLRQQVLAAKNKLALLAGKARA